MAHEWKSITRCVNSQSHWQVLAFCLNSEAKTGKEINELGNRWCKYGTSL